MTDEKNIHLKVLKALKPYLSGYKFVCIAAEAAKQGSHISEFEREIFVSMIRQRLEGWTTVACWLGSKHIRNITADEMIEYRRAWVENMIEEFSQ